MLPIHDMLYRSTFAAEYREGKQASNHSDCCKHSRQCQFAGIVFFHFGSPLI